MSTGKPDPHHLELFAGGVPPYASFVSGLQGLNEILEKFPESEGDDPPPNPSIEVCLIALIARFEAFLKDTFAAVINVCPPILGGFARRRHEDTIHLGDLVFVEFDLRRALGFLVTEHRDFGETKSINALFMDLLGITPFSKREIERYQELLELRNLFVHHGGVFTSGYARRHALPKTDEFQIFHQSPSFSFSDLEEAMGFFGEIAHKITEASWKSLDKQIGEHQWPLEPYQKKALSYIMIGVDRGWSDAAKYM